MSDKNKPPPCSYKLRVNITGFKFSDIKIALVKKPKTRVKICAKQNEVKSNTNPNNSEESCKEFTKFYDINSKYKIVVDSMRFYLDPTNSNYLIIEFESSQDENVFVNLDESCESLVEMAAKSLLNIKDIEAIRHSIENPDEINPKTNQSFADVFSTSIIKDLNSATTTSFTSFKQAFDKEGNKVIRMDVTIPAKIRSVSLADNMTKSLLKENQYNIMDLADDSVQKNHLFIRFDGMHLYLEANTVHENTKSFFSKQIKVPKGSITRELTFKLDTESKLVRLELPYFGL